MIPSVWLCTWRREQERTRIKNRTSERERHREKWIHTSRVGQQQHRWWTRRSPKFVTAARATTVKSRTWLRRARKIFKVDSWPRLFFYKLHHLLLSARLCFGAEKNAVASREKNITFNILGLRQMWKLFFALDDRGSLTRLNHSFFACTSQNCGRVSLNDHTDRKLVTTAGHCDI